MLTDAARIHKEAGADAGGNEIRQAVQAGIERGRRKSWQGRLTKGSFLGLAAAAVAAIILFLIPVIHDAAPRAAGPAGEVNWGGLEMFKRLYSSDSEAPTLDTAIRHGYIQEINQSVASGDYRITLNAVTADENKIIFLYTAIVAEGQEIYSVNSARIKNPATGYDLENGAGSAPMLKTMDTMISVFFTGAAPSFWTGASRSRRSWKRISRLPQWIKGK